MSKKKFFTLIYGDTIHTAPEGKILPQEAFSIALTADEVLERIKEDAQKYRLEVSKEAEKLKEQAQKEGFEAGFSQWIDRVAELEQEIANVHKATEKIVIPVALKAARKILGREIEQSETAIVDIVANKLKAVAQHKQITVYVNPTELARVEKGREDLKKIFENLSSFSIRPRDDIQSGGCVIETESGIINAQLDNQWEIIERAFQNLKL